MDYKKSCDMDNMILIPGGLFTMGLSKFDIKRLSRRFDIHKSWLASSLPQREIDLPPFYVDKYPVTNGDYFAYVLETRCEWRYGYGSPLPRELERLPVVNLSYAQCVAYANWAGKRLPTEEEWEKAARGRIELLFPWGNTWCPERCFCSASNTSGGGALGPVDAHPNGSSPYGVMDMAGNACEWTSSAYSGISNVIRGGCFHQSQPFAFLTSYRNMSQLGSNAQDYIGFRCAV